MTPKATQLNGRGRSAAYSKVPLFLLCALVMLALGAGSASAALTRPYESRLTEAAGAPFGAVQGLAVDGTGDLYVSDGGNHALDKFDSAGSPVTTWGTDGQLTEANLAPFSNPFGLAVDDSGDLWAADPGLAAVDKFDSSGGFLLQSSGEAHLSGFAQSVAFSDASKQLYVADSGEDDLFVLNADGSFASEIKGPWGSGCCFIRVAADNSATATSGDLYVSGAADGASPQGPGAVYRIDGTGAGVAFSETASYIEGAKLTGTPEGPFGKNQKLSVAVDSAGTLYVADSSNHRIDEFDSSGKYLGKLTGTPTGAGGSHVPFGEISAIGIGAATGKLYVADTTSDAIDAFGGAVVIPDVTTKPVSALTVSSATFNGEVDPDGLAVTECAFEYGETEAYDQSIPCAESPAEVGAGSAAVSVHADVTGLKPGAIYHFRLTAANANGVNQESGDQSFFTGAAIDSTSASRVSATAATLETELNPHGLASTYYFEYDTVHYAEGEAAHKHGAGSPEASAGFGVVDVPRSAQVQGLAFSTVYYYRVVAHNSLGTVVGPERSFTTQGATASVLPDGRQWELVSPANKHGSPLESIAKEGGLIQAAADGSGIAYIAKGPTDAEPASNRAGGPTQQLLGKRTAAGVWSTQDLATPHQAPAGFIPGNPSEYKLFSSDLSTAVVEPDGATPLSPQTSERTPYLRQEGGQYTPLVSAANVPAGTHFGGEEELPEGFGGGVSALSATPDLSHVLVSSSATLVEGFHEGTERQNIYEWSEGKLQAASVLPSGAEVSEEGEARAGNNDAQMRGAVSQDGTRVFFETTARRRLYMRDMSRGETLRLNAAQGVEEPMSNEATFQLASSDGSKAYFTDTARLTSDATAKNDAPDLYECEVVLRAEKLACNLKDLSVDPHAGQAASVQGAVLGSDEEGRYVYYVASGALVEGASSNGACPQVSEGTCENLYAYDTQEGTNRLVAVLSEEDGPDWRAGGGTNLGQVTSRVSPDGRYLAFMSQRPLTGYDNRDAQSGARDEEVFEYDYTANTLRCASCDPSGQRPAGVFDISGFGGFPGLLVDRPGLWLGKWLAGSIPGWTPVDLRHATYQSRYLSDSGRLFFNSPGPLVASDTNGTQDVYEYEPPQGEGQPASNSCTTASATYSPRSAGCVNLISAGTSPEESAFLDASESGNDVFFLTASKLSSSDVDGALDLYDAHACSAESPCPPPPPPAPPACAGDACQNPVAAPNDATPGSLTFHGPGNQTTAPPKVVVKSLTRAQKLTKALKSCKTKQNKKKRATCERTARGKYGPLKKAKRRKGK